MPNASARVCSGTVPDVHTVSVVVLDGFVPLDLAIPCDVFGGFDVVGVYARADEELCLVSGLRVISIPA